MITSHESAPATSSAQQPAGNGGFATQIRSFLLSNLTAAVGALWSVFLLVGGLFFLVYFASIGFMPEVDLQTAIAFLVVSAFTGGFLVIVLVLYLLAPGWWWVYMTRNEELLQSPLWFFWPMLGVILSILLIQNWWCLLPISLIVVIAAVYMLFSRQLLDKLRLALSSRQLLDKLDKLRLALFSRQLLDKWKAVGVFCTGFIGVFGMVLIWILIVIGLMGQTQAPRKYPILTAIGAVTFILVSNTMLVAKRSFSIGNFLILALATMFLLFIQLNTWTFIPKRVMSIYRFGNVQNASVVLNETGCVIAQHHGLKVAPYTPDPKIATPVSQKTCSLSNVIIHSRLGNTYYLEISRGNDAAMHFTMPGQNVLSWAIDESKKATTAGSPAGTQNPAPTTEIAPPNKGMEPTP